MSVLDPSKTIHILLSKGFTECNKHHKYLEFIYDNRLICSTKISHGSSDIGPALITQMAHQCCLSKSEFVDFAKCSISHQRYIEILRMANKL